MQNNILKYDIWLIDLEPTKGNEQSGIRPCIIIQNDEFFNFQGTTIVLPITGNIKKNSNFGVYLNKNIELGLTKESFIISFQIRTVSKERFIKKLGKIDDLEIRKKINNTLELSLDLKDDFLI